ncbi:serine-rich adhesin for platelets isoform X2 [Bombus flavifrons]|uniref:serine-rich adhesin for platelets isoform X2 n=1 Tax=Bombus flavifrons TaxID=103934 RepID=UPI003704260F
MMAGTGVRVGGAGMLRARRRDCSVKPNRKLDRKSSRGMIYENEELRLRTIHINAEVEQGQNDIKKLRRENEQLRREIWSLRDEYDKLEEILKRQKCHPESEEYEDRSDEDGDLQSDYSFEEDEEISEEGEDTTKEPDKSEQLDNAENQKISTEKMTSNGLHRLHVDFDDLSVVDEEEEPKRDKDKKEVSSEDVLQSKEQKSPLSILKSRQLHDNIPFCPGTYQSSTCLGSSAYYNEYPFKFPSTLNLMLPADASTMLTSPCPRINADRIGPISSLAGPAINEINDQIIHAPPVGWQSNVIMPQTQVTTYGATDTDGTPSMQSFGTIHQEQLKQQFASTIGGFPNFPSFVQRRGVGLKLSNNPLNSTFFGNSRQNSEKMIENGWSTNANLSNMKGPTDLSASDATKIETEESPGLSGTEKPKHFFAPLPSKLKKQTEESSPTVSHFGTGNSSSSGKTGSTVISKSQFTSQKGSVDLYVDGAIPYEGNLLNDKSEQRTFLSTDNLLIAEVKSGTTNQLTKSMSWQDLPSKSQTASVNQSNSKQQILTRSDNTLDNISDSKPYKSYLNVTLKAPRVEQAVSPDIPEIPKLPTIDYRLFKNPFLRSFEPSTSYMNQNNVTRPLSVQVNDDNLCCYPPQSEVPTFNRVPFSERYRPVQSDKNRLLIPSNQLMNGKLMSPTSKPQIQNLYQNVPFLPRGGLYPQRGMMYYDNLTLKVPAQTQTSIDGDSHQEDEHVFSHEESVPSTPSGRRKRTSKKEKCSANKEQNPASPTVQRKYKKQSSVTSSEVPESPGKSTRKKPTRLSITTTTSEGQEDKNESRSSSSGQDSPKKEQMRRVSLYFNAKKRPSLTSMRTVRSGSLDIGREKEAMVLNSERERTNSVSSREIGSVKARKASTSSGNVPWCACWGNGCV